MARPQRRLYYSAAFTLLWCVVAAWLIMPFEYTWRNAALSLGGGTGAGAPTWGDGEFTLGLLKFLRIEYRGIDAAGNLVGPDAGQSWEWAMPALGLSILAIIFVGMVCRSGYVMAMKKHRLVGQCDECGYDLTGLLSSRCPECGTPVERDSAKKGTGVF